MWSHYAKNHTGFCVEYTYNELRMLHKISEYPMMLAPVIYGSKNLINFTNNDEENDFQISKPVFCKAFDWIYEQEWRQILVSPEGYADNIAGILSSSAGAKSIIMGCNINAVLERMLYRICSEKKIGLEKMRMNESTYLLERDVIIRI